MCNLKRKRLGICMGNTQPSKIPLPIRSALPYPEHLSATRGAHALSRSLAMPHGYGLGILHFLLGSTFHTIGLRHMSLLFWLSTTDDSSPPCEYSQTQLGITKASFVT